MKRLVRELIECRAVLLALMIRDVKVRYKQTIVGVAWAILQPVFMMVIFSIIFSRFTNLYSEGMPYPIFCLTALVPWTFFTNAINIAIPSLVDNGSLVSKIYFPRIMLPFSSILVAMMDFFIAIIVYVIILCLFKVNIGITVLMVIPLFIIQLLFTVGIVLFASALNVFYRDIKFILPFAVQIGMFATPIVYSTTMISEKYKFFYMLNPLAGLIDGYRKVILSGVMPNGQYTFNALWVSLLAFVLGSIVFKLTEPYFGDAL